MVIKNSVFVKSSPGIQQCPKPDRPEFAFIGRSNVGKSSLINMLTERKSLAMVSTKPGKTQLINHFLINDQWYLVDLPGYGWAKVSKEMKSKWDSMIKEYLLKRENLGSVILLIDSRLEPQKIDIEFLNWMGESRVPFVIAFTKVDKQSKNKTESNLANFTKTLKDHWEVIPDIIITSAVEKTGKKEVLDFISKVINEMQN